MSLKCRQQEDGDTGPCPKNVANKKMEILGNVLKMSPTRTPKQAWYWKPHYGVFPLFFFSSQKIYICLTN